ncbi:MAG: nucleoside triphosphate pyrophosphohydrolase [Magnetococcales bacterium]|nr:nucleoside triphosphate pyrophosphohydrolase [Magnetococcales bacterium]
MDTPLTVGNALQELAALMARLRGPAGCPWDKQQSWHSLLPYTIEEAYEVAEAVETGQVAALRDELGDLLFHVVFYSQIAEEKTLFSLEEVIRTVTRKMTRRHPHVFAPSATADQAGLPAAHEVPARWEEIKRQEKTAQRAQRGESGPASLFDDVNSHLPALLWAAKVQRKMGQVGFDWPDADGVMDKVREELAELEQARQREDAAAVEEELGDLLFTLVNLARHLQLNPEITLRRATRKFQNRFRHMESCLHQTGQTVETATLEQLEALWQEAKIASGTIQDTQ